MLSFLCIMLSGFIGYVSVAAFGWPGLLFAVPCAVVLGIVSAHVSDY